MKTIKVVDYVPAPGGRYIADGPFSGEWFREEILRPALDEALRNGSRVDVHLDGAPGYGSSFLEEAFGGLIRTGGFTPKDLAKSLLVTAERRLYVPYKRLVERYIHDAKPPSQRAA